MSLLWMAAAVFFMIAGLVIFLGIHLVPASVDVEREHQSLRCPITSPSRARAPGARGPQHRATAAGR